MTIKLMPSPAADVSHGVEVFIKWSIGTTTVAVLSLWSWSVLVQSSTHARVAYDQVADEEPQESDWDAQRRLEEPLHRDGEEDWTATDQVESISVPIRMRELTRVDAVVEPALLPAAHANLSNDAEVVGLVIHGRPCAFSIDSLRPAGRQIVNLLFDALPVSVLYDPSRNFVRVASAGMYQWPVRLRHGGVSTDGRPVAEYNLQLYFYDDPELPLVDLDYERCTWGEWRRLHPDSCVCQGRLPSA